MKAIIGLGNPGKQYVRTRHNVGFMVVDELMMRWDPSDVPKAKFNAALVDALIDDQKVILAKPMTYMNRSGQSVSEIVRFYQMEPASDILIIVDDVSLPLGDIRIRPNGSAGTHNGLADIERRIGSAQYARMRIGIDDPGLIPRVDYVLGRFSEDDLSIVAPAVRRAADACDCWIHEGTTTAMNRFNSPRKRAKNDAVSDSPNPAGEDETGGDKDEC